MKGCSRFEFAEATDTAAEKGQMQQEMADLVHLAADGAYW